MTARKASSTAAGPPPHDYHDSEEQSLVQRRLVLDLAAPTVGARVAAVGSSFQTFDRVMGMAAQGGELPRSGEIEREICAQKLFQELESMGRKEG